MDKRKSVLCVLLALTLIAAGAFLPRMTAAVIDQAGSNASGSAPVQSVELYLYDRTLPQNMVRKLALEQSMYTVPARLSEASMSKEEVYAAAERYMADYASAGIFTWFPYTTWTAEFLSCIDSEHLGNTAYFWAVSYTNQCEPFQSLYLHIDDETGKILYLTYEKANKGEVDSAESSENADYSSYVLNCFSKIFFDQLGLQNMQDRGYEQFNLEEYVYVQRYLIKDDKFGVIPIEFYTSPIGLYIYYPGQN